MWKYKRGSGGFENSDYQIRVKIKQTGSRENRNLHKIKRQFHLRDRDIMNSDAKGAFGEPFLAIRYHEKPSENNE